MYSCVSLLTCWGVLTDISIPRNLCARFVVPRQNSRFVPDFHTVLWATQIIRLSRHPVCIAGGGEGNVQWRPDEGIRLVHVVQTSPEPVGELIERKAWVFGHNGRLKKVFFVAVVDDDQRCVCPLCACRLARVPVNARQCGSKVIMPIVWGPLRGSCEKDQENGGVIGIHSSTVTLDWFVGSRLRKHFYFHGLIIPCNL